MNVLVNLHGFSTCLPKTAQPRANRKRHFFSKWRHPINSGYAGSTYYSNGDLGDKYPNGVNFNEQGFPDFSPYAIADVDIEMQGNLTTDYTQANVAAGYATTPQGYTLFDR